ncbi:MAG: preprotein translocase subunit YajC [Rhodocyclaceae bacterium]|nr:preprotein translocase subunit YajC [Rhodocyclaceae bacterium]
MLISAAYAQAAGAAEPTGSMLQFLPIILMFVVLWFLMIRPQQKRAKEHQAMLGALAKGDEVVTGGGIAGRVVKIGENYVTVEIAEGVEINVQKPAIALTLPKGTLKSL